MASNTVGSVVYDASINLASLKSSLKQADSLVESSYNKQVQNAQKASQATSGIASSNAQERIKAVEQEAQSTAASIAKYSPQIQKQFLNVERANLQVTNATTSAQNALQKYGEGSSQAQSAIARLNIAIQNQSQSQQKLNSMLDGSGNSTSRFSAALNKAGVIAGATAATIGTVLNKAIDSITSSIGSAIKRVDTLNNSSRTFENMGISSQDSAKAMNALEKSIKGLPTPLDSAVRGMTSLTATYGDISKGQKVFSALNNAILGFGGTTAEVDNAIQQLSQLPLDGPLDAQTWNSLRNSGLTPVLTAMAKESGTSVSAMREAFGKGELKVQDFIDRLVKLDKDGGGGLKSLETIAKDSTKGIGTGFSNMQTAITRGLGKIIQAIGSENISNAITSIGTAFEVTLTVVSNVITWLIVNIPKAVSAVSAFGKDTVNNLVSAWSSVTNFFSTVFTNIVNAISSAVKWFSDLANVISGAVSSAFAAVGKWFSDNARLLTNIGIIIGTVLLPMFLKLGIEAAKSAGRMIAAFVTTGASAVKQAAITAAAWVSSSVKTAVAWAITLPGMIAQFAVVAAQATVQAIKTGAIWVAQAAVAAAQWAIFVAGYIAGVAVAAAQTVAAGARMAAGWLLALGPIGLIVAAVAGATALIIANWDAVSKFIGDVWTNITKWAGDSWTNIQNIFAGIGDWFAGTFNGVRNAVFNVFNGIVNFARDTVDKIVGFFSSIGKKIGDFIVGSIKGVLNGALSLLEGFLNGPINIINGALDLINKLPGVNVGKIANINLPRFWDGGFTGNGPKREAAGIVDRGEYVIPKEQVNQSTGMPKPGAVPGQGQNITLNLSGLVFNTKADKRQFANEIGKLINETSKANTGSISIVGI